MQARLLKDAGTRIFTIGIGKGVSAVQLNQIASMELADHIFLIDDFNKLAEYIDRIGNSVCEKSKYNDNNDNKKHSENAVTSMFFTLSCDLDLN